MEDLQGADICRVCRSEGLPDRPLFHPCICTGSIKWIHQECLVQWMRYSRKEYCELCGHRFSFTPIYSPDMPRRLPLRDVAGGLLSSVATAVKYWLHYTLVALAWLGVVPLTACRIYRCLFSGSVDSVSKSVCVLFVFRELRLVNRYCWFVINNMLKHMEKIWLYFPMSYQCRSPIFVWKQLYNILTMHFSHCSMYLHDILQCQTCHTRASTYLNETILNHFSMHIKMSDAKYVAKFWNLIHKPNQI